MMVPGYFCRRAALLLATLSVPLCAAAANAPYPRSSVITAASWDLSAVTTLRQAEGSDLWPVTWGADGNVYGAWGDGGGFEGTNVLGRVSLGFARIDGMPVVGNPAGFAGTNVWGAPTYAENPSTFGGKVDELISVGGVLYAQGGLWTTANCNCADPMQMNGAGPQRTLTWSADLGKTWQIAPWAAAKPLGSFLQFGQDYQGAWDPGHVYLYYQQDVNSDPTHIYLRRVATGRLTEDPATAGHYDYFAGTDSTGAAIWTSTEANALAIFQDTNVPVGSYSVGGVVYDAPLGRYLLLTFHGNYTGQIGLFEGPNPWGPWATVDYEDDWGGLNETAGLGNGMQFPTKWISSDGRTLWAVFSGLSVFDSFNAAPLTLATSNAIPQITAPALGSVLSAGATVTAAGSGDTLSWSVAYVGGAQLATGTGASITFVVPGDAQTNQLIRLTLSDSVGTIYRDFAVGAAAGPSNPVTATPAFSPAAGTYTSAQSVTISDPTPGAVIYYTVDGSVPTSTSSVYSGPINLGATQTVQAIAVAPGSTTSAVGVAAYFIVLPAAAAPAFSPAAGTYSAAQSVSITDTTPGATIYYTTDGSTPTTSSAVYSTPINVSATETLQAVAVASGYTNSQVVPALYTINGASAPLVNYSNGFGSSAGLSLLKASVRYGALVLTDGGSSEARAAWYTSPVNIQSFNTSFNFQLSPGNITADGFTFVIQNAPAGAAAVGSSGGALGYRGIPASVAVKFDLYNNSGEGNDSTGFYIRGSTPETPSLNMSSSGVNLHSGDVFSVRLSYDGTTLSMTITDTKTSATFSTSTAVNIPAIVGSNTAYVGFTGGTGKLASTQRILSWTYSGP